MKTHTVLSASVIRSFGPRLFDPIVSEFQSALKSKYRFQVGPQANPSVGLIAAYQAGRFSRKGKSIHVDQLNITYLDASRVTSIGVLTKSTTDDGVGFLDDLMSWAKRRYRLKAPQTFPTFYHSQLEVVFDAPFSQSFPTLQSLGKTVQSYLSNYGFDGPVYEPTSVLMFFDARDQQPPVPTPFSIERRVATSFSDNKFFSQAPLTTKDHLAVLKQFEKSLG
jgi:hypothetical protein